MSVVKSLVSRSMVESRAWHHVTLDSQCVRCRLEPTVAYQEDDYFPISDLILSVIYLSLSSSVNFFLNAIPQEPIMLFFHSILIGPLPVNNVLRRSLDVPKLNL